MNENPEAAAEQRDSCDDFFNLSEYVGSIVGQVMSAKTYETMEKDGEKADRYLENFTIAVFLDKKKQLCPEDKAVCKLRLKAGLVYFS